MLLIMDTLRAHASLTVLGTDMVLLVKMATRGRPGKFFALLEEYQKKVSGKHTVVFVVSCDLNDGTMNTPGVRARLSKMRKTFAYFGRSKNKIEAINADVERVKNWDILLVTADDMTPIVDGYDVVICDQMKARFPGLDGVLWFNDGFVAQRLNTLPVLGRKYYERFHYIYHPSYVALWCDNEFTDVARNTSCQQYIDQVIIRHDHPHNIGKPMDEQGQRGEAQYHVDQANYNKRKSQGFPH